jgi:hypothetical protein
MWKTEFEDDKANQEWVDFRIVRAVNVCSDFPLMSGSLTR